MPPFELLNLPTVEGADIVFNLRRPLPANSRMYLPIVKDRIQKISNVNVHPSRHTNWFHLPCLFDHKLFPGFQGPRSTIRDNVHHLIAVRRISNGFHLDFADIPLVVESF
jgi:hypothetical protein